MLNFSLKVGAKVGKGGLEFIEALVDIPAPGEKEVSILSVQEFKILKDLYPSWLLRNGDVDSVFCNLAQSLVSGAPKPSLGSII